MENMKRRDNLPSSNFFTVVVYPKEFDRLEKLYELGTVLVSPLHLGHEIDFLVDKTSCVLHCKMPPKEHYHLLIRSANNCTANSFIMRLTEVLENDFTGLALHKEDCLVKEPCLMIRYFWHLDSPSKEKLKLDFVNMQYPVNMSKEMAQAFDIEISFCLISMLEDNLIKSVSQFAQCPIFNAWLRKGHNLYYAKNVFEDYKRGLL